MDAVRQRLAALEPISRSLDWDGAALRDALSLVGAAGADFLDGLATGPAYHDTKAEPRFDASPPRAPAALDPVLQELFAQLLPFGLNPASGRFFGYVPGGGLPTAAVGDFLAALTNRYAGVHQASPGAAALEQAVVGWLRDLVGFPATTAGTLQSGGSLATLTALVAARDTRTADRWARSPIYLTAECHHCAQKALHIAGMDHIPRRIVATDDRLRMRPDALAAQLVADRAQGLAPWILIASAGTVNTGAVDPLPALADLARDHGLWFHVDGAYGGLFALTPTGAPLLRGMERADSLVLDPHKGLFLPYGCGAVLVRDGRRLRAAFSSSGDYLADVAEGADTTRSPADLSPELTRHFRGLRLWLSIKVHGIDRLTAALEEKLLLARVAHDALGRVPGLVLGPAPELSCVTFRAAAGDDATAALLAGILTRGRAHLSSTRLGGHLALRLCILNFRSHLRDVEEAVAETRAVLNSMG